MVELPIFVCMGFAHGFGHDSFLPMVSCRSGQVKYGYVLIQGYWIGDPGENLCVFFFVSHHCIFSIF